MSSRHTPVTILGVIAMGHLYTEQKKPNETLVIALMFLPASILFATLAGLAGWSLAGTETGLTTFGVTWFTIMTAAQIAMRVLSRTLADDK